MIWAQILGLICIILPLMHIFLRLRSVLALSIFDCRFVCVEPSFRRKARNWCQLSQEELQRKPNRPKSDDPTKKTREPKRAKNAAFKKRQNRSRQRLPQAARGIHHIPWGWDARPCFLGCTTVRPPLLPSCFVFLRGCSISCAVFWFELIFCA